MSSGGARLTSGPVPDPQSRRQSRAVWTSLPAAGDAGQVPKWPAGKASKAELDAWRRVWRTPHAAAWISLGWTDEVAVYVRLLVVGRLTADPRLLAEARQWSDRLGLNPAAMLRNRWRVVDEPTVRPLPALRQKRVLRLAGEGG